MIFLTLQLFKHYIYNFMSKKVLAFGASNSKNSINKQLANYAASLIPNASISVINLNDFEMPLFGVDLEKEKGIPQKATDFQNLLQDADLIIISLAEHNGSYTVAFKNIMDWKSRLEGKIWENKQMLLLSTSPGARGGASVMQTALASFPFQGADVIGSFSLPQFYEHFKEGKIVSDEFNTALKDVLGV